MTVRSFSTTLTVDQTPKAAFAAIANVKGWWSRDIQGRANKVGDTFKHCYKDVHRCEIAVKEMVPDTKIVWSVLDNYFNFTADPTEWKGTEIVFEIAGRGDKTVIAFTHRGLVPEYDCYAVCSKGWHSLIHDDLQRLITAVSA